MKIRHFVIAILAFLLVCSLASAADFTYEINAVEDSIFKHEVASYKLTIHNNQALDDTFQLSITGARWIINTEPKLETVTIPKGRSQDFTVLVKPKISVGIGPFGVPVKLKSLKTGDFVEFNIAINIKDISQAGGEYVPSVALGVSIDKKVDPRERISVDILLRNRNALNIENLTIDVDGVIFGKRYTTTLGPLEEKGNELLFSVDRLEPARSYNLNVQVIYNDQRVSESTRNFEIIAYDHDLVETETTSSFFKTTKIIRVTNDGNYKKDYERREEISGFARIFTKTDPKAEVVKENGVTYYGWAIPLNSQETTQITITTNYRLLVVIIIIIILAIIAYYVFRSPVIAMKDALVDEMKEDLSELKIRIFVKNRSRKLIHNVKVIDKVPSIAEVLRGTAVGTLKPSKIVKSAKKGTIIRWDIEELEPYEERIITYKIKSKLKIIGSMKLPATTVKFDTKAGSQRTTTSNEINVVKRVKPE